MDILPYETAYASACLTLFDSNIPEFFDPSERTGFEEFLARPDYPYWVLRHDDTILACGGFEILNGTGHARLHWGMVHREWHRKGLGRFLLLYRLKEIGRIAGIEAAEIGTSHASAPFFEKQGFRIVRVDKDGFGPGLDRVEMLKKLTVCT